MFSNFAIIENRGVAVRGTREVSRVSRIESELRVAEYSCSGATLGFPNRMLLDCCVLFIISCHESL